MAQKKEALQSAEELIIYEPQNKRNNACFLSLQKHCTTWFCLKCCFEQNLSPTSTSDFSYVCSKYLKGTTTTCVFLPFVELETMLLVHWIFLWLVLWILWLMEKKYAVFFSSERTVAVLVCTIPNRRCEVITIQICCYALVSCHVSVD